jgi:parallel beta-helix repeat protein
MTLFHTARQHFVTLILLILALILPMTPAYAEPDAPSAGGIFTVSQGADNTNAGNWLTLREAILLANGGTGPNGLNRPLEISEVLNIEGCNFAIDGGSGNAVIKGGCGEGVSDTIRVFRSETSAYYDYKINSALPPLKDSQPTIITGAGSPYPVILDFSPNQMTPGLTVNSSNNVIKDITLRGGRCNSGKYCPALYGLALNGNNNQVSNVLIHDVQGHGISVEGDNNVIDNALVGVPAGDITQCPFAGSVETTGMAGHGIYLSTGAQGTVIKNSVIGCNGLWSTGAGIYVSSGNSDTVIGPNNKIGTIGNGSSVLLGNSSSGVTLSQSQNVTVISNTIAYNGKSGVALASSSNNVIGGNLIRDNNGDGILLTAASANNKIGGPTIGSVYGGNKIGFNNSHGIHLFYIPAVSSTPPTDNVIVGNWIGTLNAASAAGNKGSGILLNGAVDTLIGDPAPATSNLIVSNAQQGIWLSGASSGNRVRNNFIGTNGFTALPNAQNGILLEEGSHHNVIGGLVTGDKNVISHNAEVGVLLSGAGTSSNSLLSNTITGNELEGVLITAQASSNNIGGTGFAAVAYNQIMENGRAGVAMTNGAQKNGIGANRINGNNRAGILFADASTQHNTVTSATIFENKGADGDGIAQKNGAVNNSWSRISSYDNDGLGIDLEAVAGFNTVTGPVPSITNISSAAGTVTLVGMADASLINEKTVTVEIYRSAADPSNHGEGQIFVVSGQTNADGDFSLNFNGVAGCFTAFQTISEGNTKRSSEFGPNVCKGTPQTITFASIDNKIVGDAAFTVNPTASSGLPVTVSAEGSCTVNAQKLVSLTGAGMCILTAQQAGDATYTPAPEKTVQFEILKKKQSITWGEDGASQPKFVDATAFSVNATASSGLPITFVAIGVCTVNGNIVTVTGLPGSCDLTAQQPGNGEYFASLDFEKSFSVSKKDQSVSFASLPDKKVTDPTFAVSATASSGLAVIFNSITPNVCTINANTVTLVNTGTCSLVASQAGNSVYNAAQIVTRTFQVQAAGQVNQQSIYLPVITK